MYVEVGRIGVDDGVVKGLVVVIEEVEEEIVLFCRIDWRDVRVVLLTFVCGVWLRGCLIRDIVFCFIFIAVIGLFVVIDVVIVIIEVVIILIGFDIRWVGIGVDEDEGNIVFVVEVVLVFLVVDFIFWVV